MEALEAVAKVVVAEVKAAEEKHKQLVTEAVEKLLAAFAEHTDITFITTIGYTPGFNDGDPCEHGGSTVFGLYDSEDYDGGIEGLEGEAYKLMKGLIDDERGVEEAAIDYGHVWCPTTKIPHSVSQIFDDYAEIKYVTDYRVTYILDNGAFKEFYQEYDCGY